MSKVILIGIIVCIVIGIAVGIFFGVKDLTKKSGGDGDAKRPELNFSNEATKTINPQEGEEKKVETYMIEYAEGDTDEKEAGKFIDLTLKWTNQEGFNGVVDKLIFTRTLDGTEVQPQKEVTEESAITDYGNGSVTFKGTEVTSSTVKGKNIIKAYYNELKQENLLATAEMEITESDFTTTLAGPFGDLVVPVSISSESFKLTKQVKKTLYQISHAPGRWFNVVPHGGGIYQFKFDDGKFLEFDGHNKFKLSKYKGKKMLLTEKGENAWVPTRGSWIPIGKMKKDDYRFAQCDLFGANLIMQTGETLNPSDKLWLSPNKEFRAVYQKSDSKNTVHAYASSNGSFNLRLSANGNISFKKSGDELIKSAQGYKYADKHGLTAPFLFMVSDFGGLHVVSKEGVEVMNVTRAFGPLSNYYKTHAGDLWGYDNEKYTG